MRIISLSTIPPRFSAIGGTLKSLTSQKGRIDEIRLYVPRHYRRFPDYDGSLPEVPDGVTVIRADEDLGPATKVLFAAKDLRGKPAQILFCDDDVIFRPTWANELFAEQERRPDACVALWGKFLPPGYRSLPSRRPLAQFPPRHRSFAFRTRHFFQRLLGSITGRDVPRATRSAVSQAGYADLILGVGGVVIRPDFFDDEALAIPPVLWSVDDIWLSGMLAKKNVPIWLPAGLAKPGAAKASEIDSLQDTEIEGAGRKEANRRCIEYMRERFNIWQ